MESSSIFKEAQRDQTDQGRIEYLQKMFKEAQGLCNEKWKGLEKLTRYDK